jgi:ribosomal protein S18 acetylase RimI-like enzyme
MEHMLVTKSSPTFQIRDARDDEHAAIRALTWAAYAEYATIMTPPAWAGLEQALRQALDADAIRIVAERDGALVGSVMLFAPSAASYGAPEARSSVPELRLLAVAPEARGAGVGEALVAACVARARQLGASAIGLHTSESMQAAIRIYTRMGFVRAPERDFQPPGAELVQAYELQWYG